MCKRTTHFKATENSSMVNEARLKILMAKQYQNKSLPCTPWSLFCLNVGPASKTVSNIETLLVECPVFAGRANVCCTDSVMTAIIASWQNLISHNGLRNYIKPHKNNL